MITNGWQTIGETRVKVDGRTEVYSELRIHNRDTTKTLFVGGPDVTATNGFPIDKLGELVFQLPPLQDLYCVSATGNVGIAWMRIEIR